MRRLRRPKAAQGGTSPLRFPPYGTCSPRRYRVKEKQIGPKFSLVTWDRESGGVTLCLSANTCRGDDAHAMARTLCLSGGRAGLIRCYIRYVFSPGRRSRGGFSVTIYHRCRPPLSIGCANDQPLSKRCVNGPKPSRCGAEGKPRWYTIAPDRRVPLMNLY